MDIKKITEKITLPIAILLSAIILAVGFYAVQYSQQKSIERQQQIKQAETEIEALLNRRLLDACLSDAQTTYLKQWDIECEAKELEKDCSLPKYNADSLDDYRKELKDQCFKKYPQ